MNSVCLLGKKLIDIRHKKGFSQRQVAELAGLTHGTISMIEQDRVSPALSTLQKILNAYNLSLIEFFNDENKQQKQLPKIIFSADELVKITSEGVDIALLRGREKLYSLVMMIKIYQPGAITSEKVKHQGEEIGTLLEGEIVLTVGGVDYSLQKGQSYVFNTSLIHSFSNVSTHVCRIISVHAPATC